MLFMIQYASDRLSGALYESEAPEPHDLDFEADVDVEAPEPATPTDPATEYAGTTD